MSSFFICRMAGITSIRFLTVLTLQHLADVGRDLESSQNLFQNFKRHRGTRSADFAGPRNPLFEPFGRSDVVGIEADVVPAETSV